VSIGFGGFTLDPGARQLLRGGQVLHLSRKAFDLLAILLERRPAVVDKTELRDRLWGGVNVVDANLNNLVSEIRTALQDDPQQPRFVRTVHRIGYAFCGAAVDEPEQPAAASRTARCWLVWNDRTFALSAADAIIGRDPESAIWIDAPGVSRRHARIRVSTDGDRVSAAIEDLGSTNGTFVNGRRVTTLVALDDGQPIRIGEATLTFRTSSSMDAPTKRIARRR
jgi:DNA-binding winged helix-turn-helix (wHTH) protein